MDFNVLSPIESVALKAAFAQLTRGDAVVLRIERLGQFHIPDVSSSIEP